MTIGEKMEKQIAIYLYKVWHRSKNGGTIAIGNNLSD